MDASTTLLSDASDHESGSGSRHAAALESALTFPALFAKRVAAYPDRPAFFDVSFNGPEAQAAPQTWSEVDVRARRAAAALVKAGVVDGDRVVLCVSRTSNFLSFFVAAQGLGGIPVPLPSVSDCNARMEFRERVAAVLADCEPRAIVVDTRRELDLIDPDLAANAAVIDASALDDPGSGDVEELAALRLERSPEEIAFLQYTSGSTGAPKGVVVTHGNLMANLGAIARAADLGPTERTFNWLPLYHDMGLIGGVLLGLYVGGEVYVMPTKTFVGRPASWLRAMSQFKATVACAPNFAYSLLARRLPDRAFAGLDLSHWRRAFNGAEPIDRSSLEDFLRRFGPSRFPVETMFPVYGLAECTLAVAIPEPGAAPRYDFVDRDVFNRDGRAVETAAASPSALCFVGVGRAVPGLRVRIVDPKSDDELPERHVGEVVVSGTSVTPYYFRKDGKYPPPREQLRTGDLGYFADGDLFIVDRLKDLLIVGGRNIVPSDVERVVAGIRGTRYGAIVAFAIRGSEGTDELYLVVGVELPALHDEGMRDEIRRTVHLYFGVTPRDVVLVKPKVVPKTSSGKVRRAACRDLYERRALVPDAASAEHGDDVPE